MSFDTNLRTMMGVRPAEAVTQLAAAGADAVGANCGRGPEEMEIIAAEMGMPAPVNSSWSPSRTPAFPRWWATTSSTTPPPTTWLRTPAGWSSSVST